ncbi:MAG TPA: hypothetical protein IAB97_09080, partial [Candidatus Choladousia intestinipullorum]|nr:hypothetical protein [Candidatus Choladousia intestinipullorum]
MRDDRHTQKKKIRWDHIVIWIAAIILTVCAVGLLLHMLPEEDENVDLLLEEADEFSI